MSPRSTFNVIYFVMSEDEAQYWLLVVARLSQTCERERGDCRGLEADAILPCSSCTSLP